MITIKELNQSLQDLRKSLETRIKLEESLESIFNLLVESDENFDKNKQTQHFLRIQFPFYVVFYILKDSFYNSHL